MLRLHTSTTPNGRKISIALEELGVPYEVRRVNLQAEEQLRPEFLALNPNHKIPVLGIGPNLGRLGAALRKPGEKNQEMIDLFSGEVRRLIGVLDRILGDGRPYLAGPYSIGDIMHYPWLSILLGLGAKDLTEQKRVVGWLERIGARPAVQRGMKVPE